VLELIGDEDSIPLNGHGSVIDKTREFAKDAYAELGYVGKLIK
jgi:hypothetical protein